MNWTQVFGAQMVLWLVLVSPASAESKASETPRIALDRLLELPPSLELEVNRRGGATRSEWRQRFVDAEVAVVEARAELDKALGRMSDLANQGGGWKMSPPGSSAVIDDTTPINYGLKQEIKRRREEIKRTERELDELKIEANLTGVPNSWLTAK